MDNIGIPDNQNIVLSKLKTLLKLILTISKHTETIIWILGFMFLTMWLVASYTNLSFGFVVGDKSYPIDAGNKIWIWLLVIFILTCIKSFYEAIQGAIKFINKHKGNA